MGKGVTPLEKKLVLLLVVLIVLLVEKCGYKITIGGKNSVYFAWKNFMCGLECVST
jgi:hypothetical protein